jgi:hypothetical protein
MIHGALDVDDERSTCKKGRRSILPILPFEPLLRLEHSNLGICLERHHAARLFSSAEGVLAVDEATTVKEGRNDFDDLLAPAVDVATTLAILPSLVLMAETMRASTLQISPT